MGERAETKTKSILRGGLAAAMALAALLALAACRSGDDPTAAPTNTPDAPAASTETVKIGALMDSTGPLAEFGPPNGDAVALALKQVNDAGGVLGGRMIELLTEDDGTSEVIAVDAARKLITVDGVSVLIGPLGSGPTLAVANAVTVQNRVPHVSSTASSPSLTLLEDNDFLFRTNVSDAFQGVILADLAYKLGYRSAGALYINNAYGQGLADQFAESFMALGGTATTVSHEEGQPTYASELRQATANAPDVLVAVSYPVSAGVYVREAVESGDADTFLFVDATKSDEMITAVGAANLEGTWGTSPEGVQNDASARFAMEYEAEYGRAAGPFNAQSYDAGAVVALAIESAGSDDPAAIRDALRAVANPPGTEIGPGAAELARGLQLLRDGQQINYQGASGPVDFDENGDVLGAIGVWRILNGEIATDHVVMSADEIDVDAPDPVKIGSLMDFTGVLAEYGVPIHDAVVLAAQHLNAAGGVLGGRRIEIIQADGATSEIISVDAARKMATVDGVSGIVGPLGSGATTAVANAVTVQLGVPEITSSATAPSLTLLEDDDFLFRTTPSDAFQGVVLANLAWELGYRNAGVLYINNAYGVGLADQFAETFFELGGEVLTVPHESGAPTYASEIAEATFTDPDVLVAMSYPVSAGVYVREAIESRAVDNFLFVDGTRSADFIEAVGASALEGSYGTAPGPVEGPAAAQFDADFAAVYGAERAKAPFLRNSYDAMAIFGLAIEAAGSDDREAIRDALRRVAGPPGVEVGPGVDELARALQLIRDGQEVNYEGASGPVDFDENGDVAGAMEIWRIVEGEIVVERVVSE